MLAGRIRAEWTIALSPDRPNRQMAWLLAYRRAVSLPELAALGLVQCDRAAGAWGLKMTEGWNY